MGMFESLMDQKYDSEIEFLKLLSDYRTHVQYWFNFGKTMRDLPLQVNNSYK